MADNEATAGAVNDTGSTPATNWYHIYVPFYSGTPGTPTALTAGYTPDAPADGTTNDCLPNPTTSAAMGSFLHIGAINPDLLTSAAIAGTSANFDSNAQKTFMRALNLTNFVSNGFLDDYRVRGSDASSTTQRQAESANLYSKGGWRDHTDGNRITTTVGDKVEVIGGNHVMMILGRPTRDNSLDNSLLTGSPSATHQIETSGGLSYSNDAGPGHIEEVRWVSRSYGNGATGSAPGDGGTWMVRQKSQFGDEVSISAGLSHESSVGIGVEINSGTAYSYHGAIEDIPQDLLNNADFNLTDIWRDENTQASSAPYFSDMSASESLVTSIKNNRDKVYSGSNPVPTQKTVEYTNLDSTYSNATVNTVEEHTTINSSKTEYTTINGTSFAQTTVNGNTSEVSLIAGGKEETDLMIGPVETIAMYLGLKEEITLSAANILTIDIALLKEELTICASSNQLNLSASSMEAKLGNFMSMGAGTEEMDLAKFSTYINNTSVAPIHSVLGFICLN